MSQITEKGINAPKSGALLKGISCLKPVDKLDDVQAPFIPLLDLRYEISELWVLVDAKSWQFRKLW